jgi:hypothetical protein
MKAMVYDFHTDIYPTDEDVKELCRPGAGADTCSWLMIGPKGWECCCLNKPAILMERRENGSMVAQRDGCDKVYGFVPTRLGEIEF